MQKLSIFRYVLVVAAVSLPLAAHAQQSGPAHSPGMDHGVQAPTSTAAHQGPPTEPGQGAFAAIQEIVAILDSDPDTDWSKVDIDGLRRHLVDMNNVTLHAEVVTTPVPNGARYVVTGDGAVRDSIRRMVKAHARTMSGANGMTITASDHPDGAVMKVTVADQGDLARLEGLGFFGVMALGVHHQEHHLMIAAGHAPHH
jgi:hypothetical protein